MIGSSLTPLALTSSIRKIDRRHTGRLRKRYNLLPEEGRVGGRAKS
jgi:hypothetical protein